MTCESCGSDTRRVVIESRVIEGRSVIIKYCESCPMVQESKKRGRKKKFPAIITKGWNLDQFRVSDEQIAKVKVSAPYRDIPGKRDLDNVDGVLNGTKCVIYKGASGGLMGKRNAIVKGEIVKQLRTEDYKITYDDGLKVVAEVNHAR